MAMGKILAFCNQKGGVGKTTSAVNISACLAAKGKKVLLIDTDPQANATSGLGVNKRAVARSTYDLLVGQAALAEIMVAGPVPGLSLVPANVALTGAEVELVDMPQREFRLQAALESVRQQFDFVFVDCPPSLGLLTLNALVAANGVIIPIQCEYYALEGLSQLMDTINLVKKRLNPGLTVEGVILTMADFRTRLTQEVIKEVRDFFKDRVFDSIVPRNIRLSEAPGFGKPIMLYDPFSLGAMKYDALADELIMRQPDTVQGIVQSQDVPQEQLPRGDAAAAIPHEQAQADPGAAPAGV